MARNQRKKTGQYSTKHKTASKYQVFVSHATSDKWLAKVICEKIEGVGASTFRDDRDINGGDDIPEEIRKRLGLKTGDKFLVMSDKDVVILKTLSNPSMDEFDDLVKEARKQAKVASLKRTDIVKAIAKSRAK